MSLQSQKPLWTPTPEMMEQTLLVGFIKDVERRTGLDFGTYGQDCYKNLLLWSNENPAAFWDVLWDYCEIAGEKGDTVLTPIEDVPYHRFFPNGRISYAENMLRYWLDHQDQKAIIYRHQDGPDQILNGKDLCESVSRWEQALRAAGLSEGDRLGVYLTNRPETVVLLIAASNIGAPLVTAGMEMGGDDMIERFGRAAPKMLVTADSYTHGEKVIDRADVIARAQKEISSLERTVLVASTAGTAKTEGLKNTVTKEAFLQDFNPQDLSFIRRDFNHPLYILFSSGTTGAPKGFVHSTGGILIKHMADYVLQADVQPGDKFFYHSTPSWMMWNLLASGLMAGATILMHDGNPGTPDAGAQLRFTAAHGCTHHGTSAAVIQDIWMANNLKISKDIDLSAQRTIMYTGGVLPDVGFEYIMKNIDPDVQIGGITGGTDFVSVSIGGNSFMPVYAGALAAPYLGMDVQIWNERGKPAAKGEAGELVIAGPFPSMPLAFVDDPDGDLYRDAYFDYFYEETGRRVWRHGDSIQETPEGQIVVIGRSDATLNQNDVRIGPIKIYKQLTHERIGDYADQIKGYTAVDFMTPIKKQPKTVLFLELPEWESGVPEVMAKAVRKAVKDNVGPYSVPTEIIAVPSVLRTKNGKLAEIVTKKVINGKTIKNASLYGEDLVAHYEQLGKDLTEKYAAAENGLQQKSA